MGALRDGRLGPAEWPAARRAPVSGVGVGVASSLQARATKRITREIAIRVHRLRILFAMIGLHTIISIGGSAHEIDSGLRDEITSFAKALLLPNSGATGFRTPHASGRASTAQGRRPPVAMDGGSRPWRSWGLLAVGNRVPVIYPAVHGWHRLPHIDFGP